MTGLAAGHLLFPTANFCELGMRGMRERLELIFMAVLASLAADVIFRLV